MADIYISLSELEIMDAQLKSIVQEFESAVDRSEELEAAIGDPFGKGDLREKAEDFEERWDLKRDELKEGLSDIQKHLHGVIEGVSEADAKMAIELEKATSEIGATTK